MAGERKNLTILGETLGIDLELEAQEKAVGPFRADLQCKDIGTGTWVLIENQLERTDHDHLGQLLTYASGLEAVTIVWIAARFTDEHRSTLDWLNRIIAFGDSISAAPVLSTHQSALFRRDRARAPGRCTPSGDAAP